MGVAERKEALYNQESTDRLIKLKEEERGFGFFPFYFTLLFFKVIIMRIVSGHEVVGTTRLLNIVAEDVPGENNDNHHYSIYKADPTGEHDTAILVGEVRFQKGNPEVVGVNGVTSVALLQINIDYLTNLQEGPSASAENQLALEHLLAARDYLPQ